MKSIAAFAAVVCPILCPMLGLSSMSFAKTPVPRQAEEFRIADAAGGQISLSSYRGKVILVQFLSTTCPHCQATARMFSKLQHEFGPRGLQIVGVAFNPEAQGRSSAAADFVKTNGVEFPVGTASLETVLSYLRISVMERFVVPQIVIIDRNGMIRAQSDALGSAELQDESYVRSLLDRLLPEKIR